MKIVKQSWSFEVKPNGSEILNLLERCGRTCYKSEDKITADSSRTFVKSIMSKNHESVIEHASASVRIITDRGVTHEIVRHRLMSYSQESTRYCNYSKDKYGNELTVILPVEFYDVDLESETNLFYQHAHWYEAMVLSEKQYFYMLKMGATPQLARSVLPNSLKTEIVVTGNLRNWKHFFKLRTSNAAHPQLKALARDMLIGFKNEIPVIFDDIEVN